MSKVLKGLTDTSDPRHFGTGAEVSYLVQNCPDTLAPEYQFTHSSL